MHCALKLTGRALRAFNRPRWEREGAVFAVCRGVSSESNVIRSVYRDVEIPNSTVGQFMWRELHLWPERTALVCGATGRQIRYEELRRMCASFGAALRGRLGAREDDCLALLLPNVPAFPVAALGALDAGCVVSPINIMYTKESNRKDVTYQKLQMNTMTCTEEVARQLQMSGAKFAVTSGSLHATVEQAARHIGRKITIIVTDDTGAPTPEGAVRFNELAEDTSPDLECLKSVRRSPTDVAFLPYSSGTTGLPKGVQISHQNVVASICQQTLTDDLMLTLKCTNDFQDSMLCVIPFFHISGLMVQLMSRLNIGNKLVTVPRFRPDHFIQLQREHRTTAMLAAPPLALFLANYPEVTGDVMASFRNLLFGAAPSAESDLERIYEKNPSLTIAQGYGLTESTGVAIANKAGSHNYASCGFMVANSQIKVVSPEDSATALDFNQVGELWLRGPHIMLGYKDNAQATSEAFAEGGWFRSGDLGYCDRTTREFYIVDRLKDLIKVKGFQVAPAELEGILRLHPKIGDAAVVGVPHPQHGETPKAFVVVDDDSAVSEEDIKRFVAERVAPYKHITLVEYIDEIPKSPAGKILRKQLKVATTTS